LNIQWPDHSYYTVFNLESFMIEDPVVEMKIRCEVEILISD
jgi:hypothetical protein